uniref:Ig-like domain-containing protein n=1 Tax=Ornithorhynchus anatinus TaxID=9258 RepID=F6ZNC6_ORNAN
MEKALGDLFLILWFQLSYDILCVCHFSLTGTNEQNEVEQNPPTSSVQEGEDCMINCNYTDKTTDYLIWYKKDLGKGLFSVISLVSTSDKEEGTGRFSVSLWKAEKSINLRINALELGDSAVYFCAYSKAHSERMGKRSCSKTLEFSALLSAGGTWGKSPNPDRKLVG